MGFLLSKLNQSPVAFGSEARATPWPLPKVAIMFGQPSRVTSIICTWVEILKELSTLKSNSPKSLKMAYSIPCDPGSSFPLTARMGARGQAQRAALLPWGWCAAGALAFLGPVPTCSLSASPPGLVCNSTADVTACARLGREHWSGFGQHRGGPRAGRPYQEVDGTGAACPHCSWHSPSPVGLPVSHSTVPHEQEDDAGAQTSVLRAVQCTQHSQLLLPASLSARTGG